MTLNKLRAASINDVYDDKLNNPNNFPVICLAYATLHARPVILSMLREWLNHALLRIKLNKKDFLIEFDAVVNSEFHRLLSKERMSEVLTGTIMENPFPAFPVLGHTAIYSLNLMLLRVVLSDNDYIFDESKVLSFSDGSSSWDRLLFLWRSWFSIENLNGVSNIIVLKREKEKVYLSVKDESISSLSTVNWLDVIINTSTALGDNLLAGLAGLHKFDPAKNELSELNNYQEMNSLPLGCG